MREAMASKDRLTIEERALTLLANKEKEIEALKREVADKAEARVAYRQWDTTHEAIL